MHDSNNKALSSQTILLVDDNPVNLQILKKTLGHTSYHLLTAEAGEQALQLAKCYQPSLILLDILMPGMDGFEVCEALKADSDTQDSAVIFLSSLDDSETKLKGFSLGGVDYISKPFQADEVVARVGTHLKLHHLERQLARRNIELEADNHQILNAINEGVIALDPCGSITRLNPAAAAITGWQEAECLGEKLHNLGLFCSGGQAVQEQQTLPYRSYHLSVRAHSHMETIYRKDGSAFHVAMNCTPRSGGGAVVVLRDISEWVESEEALRMTREQLEQQRQNMAHMERRNTMGEMAAGIAHEVNQPLTAIANYSRVADRLLAAEVLDKNRLAEVLEKIDVQARRASDVVAQVRGYVKKPLVGRQVINANNMIKDVIALAEVDSRANDVSVHFESKAKITQLCVDEVQIQQVVLNLIRNAMDAMKDLEGVNKAVMVTVEQDSYGVLFKVTDHGSGISAETEANMFNPFYTTKSSGMGIGLSVCQSIIRAHGGELGFYRNSDQGVTFYFNLPLLALV
jgi:PAS domain S-box-containing protein